MFILGFFLLQTIDLVGITILNHFQEHVIHIYQSLYYHSPPGFSCLHMPIAIMYSTSSAQLIAFSYHSV